MATSDTRSRTEAAPEREKKKGGFLARLFGRGAAGGGAGAEGFGGAWNGFGGAAGGGLLATKSGLLVLALLGAAAAGGIGYRLLGSAPSQAGGEPRLFAQKPKDSPSAAAPAAPYTGDSESLKYLAQANPAPGAAAPEAAPSAPPADAAASNAAPEPAPAAAADVPINQTPVASDNGVNKALLKNVGRFGELTKTSGSSGFTPLGAGLGAGAAKSADAAAASASPHGTAGARGKGVAMAGGRARGRRSFGSTNAARQAFGVRRDNSQATASSAQGGTTYDGAAPSAGGNSGGGTAIGPADAASAAAQATSLPNGAAPSGAIAPPATPTVQNAAPWQNAIKTAQSLIGVSVMLLLIASWVSKLKPYGMIVAKVLGFIVAGIGAMVIALGAQISGGQYGQKLQGGVLAAAGTGLIIAGVAAGLMDSSGGNANADPAAGDGAGVDAAGDATSGSGSSSGSFLSGINPFVLLGGGAALVGLAGSMMVPPKQYPSSDFQNGKPPDSHWFGYREPPSRTALKKMTA